MADVPPNTTTRWGANRRSSFAVAVGTEVADTSRTGPRPPAAAAPASASGNEAAVATNTTAVPRPKIAADTAAAVPTAPVPANRTMGPVVVAREPFVTADPPPAGTT